MTIFNSRGTVPLTSIAAIWVEAVTTSSRFLYKMTVRGIMSVQLTLSPAAGELVFVDTELETLNDWSFRGQHSAQELLNLS